MVALGGYMLSEGVAKLKRIQELVAGGPKIGCYQPIWLHDNSQLQPLLMTFWTASKNDQMIAHLFVLKKYPYFN